MIYCVCLPINQYQKCLVCHINICPKNPVSFYSLSITDYWNNCCLSVTCYLVGCWFQPDFIEKTTCFKTSDRSDVLEHYLIQRRSEFPCHDVVQVTDNCWELHAQLSHVLRPCFVLLFPLWNLSPLLQRASVTAAHVLSVQASVCVWGGVMFVCVCVKRWCKGARRFALCDCNACSPHIKHSTTQQYGSRTLL